MTTPGQFNFPSSTDVPNMSEVHREVTGQTALYQTADRYFEFLHNQHGDRFLAYRRRWEETSTRGNPGDFPLSLDLAINSGCQLACHMCPLHGRPEARKVRLMPTNLFQSLMEQAQEHCLPALTLGLGSEPLLHPQVTEWIERAGKAGIMDIRMGTNGLLLNEDTCHRLVNGPLTRLEISVDATNPKSYLSIRGGKLEELERAIELFLAARNASGNKAPLLRLSFLRLELNQGEEEEFLKKWVGLADMISLQELIWFPDSGMPQPLVPGRPMAPTCAQSWQRLSVTSDGGVWPCCSWYGEEILKLNAADMEISRIWHSPPMTGLRQALAGEPSGFPAGCRRCEY